MILCPLWTRVLCTCGSLARLWRALTRGETSHRGDAFFIFSPGQAEGPPLCDRHADPRDFLDHDLGEPYTRQCEAEGLGSTMVARMGGRGGMGSSECGCHLSYYA